MKKILVIRFSSIGDIVLTSPVVRCLKKQLGAEIHFLTKVSFRSVVEHNPYIDQIITISDKTSEVLPRLRREKYHYIIDLHRNLRSFIVKANLFNVKHYSFDKLNLEKWLMVRFKVNRLPGAHIVDRYLSAVGPLKIENDGLGLDYFIAASDEVDTDRFIESEGTIIETLKPDGKGKIAYTAFVIGAAHATKRLPKERIVAWCARISTPIILLGGPDDKVRSKFIAEQAGAHVFDACGRLRLNQSASVVRQASLVISHDTGLMHIAAAYRKRIWSVWGNTIPEFGMYPYYPENEEKEKRFEVNNLACRPCSKIGHQACPRGHFRCMQEIELQAIPDKP